MRTPKYRKRSSNGRHYAFCRVHGKNISLGRWNSPESKDAYRQIVADFHAGIVRDDGGCLVADVVANYADFARDYYNKNGKPTSEQPLIRCVLKQLLDTQGTRPANEFGPRRFKVFRTGLVSEGLARKTVNHYCLHVVRAFRQAAADELIPAEIYHAIRSVEPLREGRTGAKERAPIPPVTDKLFFAAKEHASAIIADMMQLQRLTGMRPGEVVSIRPADMKSGKMLATGRCSTVHVVLSHTRDEAVEYLNQADRTGDDLYNVFASERLDRCEYWITKIRKGQRTGSRPRKAISV